MKYRVIFIIIFLSISISAKGEGIIFGVASVLSPEGSATQYMELSKYIEKDIGVKVSVIHKPNYAEMNGMIESGDVTFASVCTGALIHMPQNAYRLLVIPIVDGKAVYRSYIIVNKKAGIKDIEGLKSKFFALTDPLSNSGSLYPLYFVKKNTGVKADSFFSKIFYTASHDKSIYLVNKGVVDGAAVDSIIYNNILRLKPDAVSNIEIINKSPEFTAPPFVVSKTCNEKEFKLLQESLISMDKDEEGRKLLSSLGITKFILPDSSTGLDNILMMKKYLDDE